VEYNVHGNCELITVSNEQKLPLARTLPLFAQNTVLDEIYKRGQALPGTVVSVLGSIVTVNFEVVGATLPKVQMPIFGPEYIRYPIQVRDKGVAFPASVSLAGVTGLGATGTAASFNVPQGNLSTLVWFPIANKNWTLPPGADANTLAIYGHLATLLLDSLSGNSTVKLTSSGITMNFGSGSLTMNSSGITMSFSGHSVVINSTGVIIDGKDFLMHVHTLVTIGEDDSGPVGP
jgi:hypothetical protein